MDNIEAIEYINSITSRLENLDFQNSTFDKIETSVGFKFPQYLKNLFGLTELQEPPIDIFSGFEFEGIETLEMHYAEMLKKNSVSFFSIHQVDSNFFASESAPIFYEEAELSCHYTEDEEIKDLRKVVPLFRISTSSLLLNLGGNYPGELLLEHEDFTFSIYAPSLLTHLEDLVDGLKSNRYMVFGDNDYRWVSCPNSWAERLRAKRDNLAFDEDCEICDK